MRILVEGGFILHPQLKADCYEICQHGAVKILLLNDARYHWLILVPSLPDIIEWIDLPEAVQLELHHNVMLCANVLRNLYAPDKINIGALGNLVSQLHVHVLARFTDDPAWPSPVWGHSPAEPYNPDAVEGTLEEIRSALT